MRLTIEAQAVVNRLNAGQQPRKDTPQWILEGLEQALLIQWGSIDGSYNGWKLMEVKE